MRLFHSLLHTGSSRRTNQPITLSISKQAPTPDCERNGDLIVTRVSFRTVSYVAVDKRFSGSLPQWVFLQGFQPRDREEKAALNRPPSPTKCAIPNMKLFSKICGGKDTSS